MSAEATAAVARTALAITHTSNSIDSAERSGVLSRCSSESVLRNLNSTNKNFNHPTSTLLLCESNASKALPQPTFAWPTTYCASLAAATDDNDTTTTKTTTNKTAAKDLLLPNASNHSSNCVTSCLSMHVSSHEHLCCPIPVSFLSDWLYLRFYRSERGDTKGLLQSATSNSLDTNSLYSNECPSVSVNTQQHLYLTLPRSGISAPTRTTLSAPSTLPTQASVASSLDALRWWDTQQQFAAAVCETVLHQRHQQPTSKMKREETVEKKLSVKPVKEHEMPASPQLTKSRLDNERKCQTSHDSNRQEKRVGPKGQEEKEDSWALPKQKKIPNKREAVSWTSDNTDELLLPPPKKKWIRHYFTAATAAVSMRGVRAGAMPGAGSPHHLLLQSGSGSSEDSHMSCVSGSSSGTSPPRQYNSSSGNHFLQITGGSNIGATHSGSQTSLHSGSGRRRTISSNSNGAAGTREVHNKLEKNRRAHLKECYEQLKNQLPLRDEERKKTSNLAILSEALKHVIALKQQDKELEVEVEQLAKDKINAQKKLLSLKRELGPRYEHVFSNSGMSSDIELSSIPIERENLNDSGSLSSGHGSMLYSSSSSLSSGGSNGSSGSNTVSSPESAGYQQQLQTGMATALSSVITQKLQQQNTANNSTCANSKNIVVSTSMSLTRSTAYEHFVVQQVENADNQKQQQVTNVMNVSGMPLSLTAKNISATSLTRGSPTPSTPSPSPSSSSGISSSSSLISSSPPMNGGGVINGVVSSVASCAKGGATVARNVSVNIPNGIKFQALNANSSAARASTAIITTTPVNGGSNSSHNAVVATLTSSSVAELSSGDGNGNVNGNSVDSLKRLQRETNFSYETNNNSEESPNKIMKLLKNTAIATEGTTVAHWKKVASNIIAGQHQKPVNCTYKGCSNLHYDISSNNNALINILPTDLQVFPVERNSTTTSTATSITGAAFYQSNGKLLLHNEGASINRVVNDQQVIGQQQQEPQTTISLINSNPGHMLRLPQSCSNAEIAATLQRDSTVAQTSVASAPAMATGSPQLKLNGIAGNFGQLAPRASTSGNNQISAAKIHVNKRTVNNYNNSKKLLANQAKINIPSLANTIEGNGCCKNSSTTRSQRTQFRQQTLLNFPFLAQLNTNNSTFVSVSTKLSTVENVNPTTSTTFATNSIIAATAPTLSPKTTATSATNEVNFPSNKAMGVSHVVATTTHTKPIVICGKNETWKKKFRPKMRYGPQQQKPF